MTPRYFILDLYKLSLFTVQIFSSLCTDVAIAQVTQNNRMKKSFGEKLGIKHQIPSTLPKDICTQILNYVQNCLINFVCYLHKWRKKTIIWRFAQHIILLLSSYFNWMAITKTVQNIVPFRIYCPTFWTVHARLHFTIFHLFSLLK